MSNADLTDANLTGCHAYGVSAWGLKLSDETSQRNLIITKYDEPQITDIEVAQFIYLMLNNQKIRRVIDTITSKAVLILGRFTDQRKVVLDALRDELRKRDYLPILFDFEKSDSRNTDENNNVARARGTVRDCRYFRRQECLARTARSSPWDTRDSPTRAMASSIDPDPQDLLAAAFRYPNA